MKKPSRGTARLLLVVLAIGGGASCDDSMESFREAVEEGMTIDDAVSALRTTAAERSRSWLMIYFECTIADHSEIVSGWDKDALGLESVETSEVVSALASCEKVKVCVRFYNYVSRFSFGLDSDGRVRDLGPIDQGAAR
jgi:hypothetical protein